MQTYIARTNYSKLIKKISFFPRTTLKKKKKKEKVQRKFVKNRSIIDKKKKKNATKDKLRNKAKVVAGNKMALT